MSLHYHLNGNSNQHVPKQICETRVVLLANWSPHAALVSESQFLAKSVALAMKGLKSSYMHCLKSKNIMIT